jgi:RNA polymerase sigma-70 factor (ECF subfamily)
VGLDFDQLIKKHKDAVYRQMYRMCGNHDDAEDVLVESLLKAYGSLPQLKHEGAFEAWLAQIARRTCGRLKRRERLTPILALATIEGTHLEPRHEPREAEALDRQLKECILHAFEALPKTYSEVYRYRDIDGLTAEETAKKLGITVAAVKSRLHRARSMVRSRIDRTLLDS